MNHPIATLSLLVALGFGSVAACGAFEFGSQDLGSGSGASTGTGYGGGFEGPTTTTGGQNGLDSYNFTAFCGDSCVPGTNSYFACDAGDEGGIGGLGGTGGMNAGGMGGYGGSANGGSGGSADGGGGGGASGGGGGGLPMDALVSDCRLGVTERGLVEGTCVETNTSNPVELGAACLTSSDCGVGQGCVLIDEHRQCRPYCCGAVEECPTDTFCALAQVAAGDVPPNLSSSPEIPVCVAADHCSLNDDCPDPTKTCTVVRQMGEVTSCVEPGNGLMEDACPCAAGHFCDTEANRCLKFCELGVPDACPTGFSCQGGSTALPEAFGTCVGTD